MSTLSEKSLQTIHHNLREKTAYLLPLMSRSITNPSEANRLALPEEVRRGSDTRITIITEMARCFSTSEQPAELLLITVTVPAIALKSGEAFAKRHSDSVDCAMLYYAKRFPLAKRRSRDCPRLHSADRRRNSQKLSRMLIFGGTFGTLSLGLGFYLAHRITSPIRQMTLACRSHARRGIAPCTFAIYRGMR
ncbi:MAG: hypothetical protein R3B54_18140 [Bdellovibrionota bacterium]